MIRIVLVDDHPLVREGIRGMLAQHDDLEVVGEASSGPEGVARADELRPDVVLMDLRMPGGDGVPAIRQITDAALAKVVVLTTYESDADILPAVEAGAIGYLLKDVSPAELARSLRAAVRGETVLAPAAQTAVLSHLRGGRTPAPTLSTQEVAVLRSAAQGNTNASIGAALHISETTVKTYLSRAFEKLEVNDRTSAVRRAIELGLIE